MKPCVCSDSPNNTGSSAYFGGVHFMSNASYNYGSINAKLGAHSFATKLRAIG